MDIHDPHRLTLLVVRGRKGKGCIETNRAGQRADQQNGNKRVMHKAEKALRIGVSEK